MTPNYKETLNLPKTDFPMKADLAVREPDRLKHWEGLNLYEKIITKNADQPKYILHDGPPYANGSIHFGHILNKVLKDIVIKYKNMTGHLSPYVPGWDCHGLPIEHQVDKDLGPKKKTMSKVQIRKACREYATKYIDIQRNEFKRLGILGDWDHPYMTMSPLYEGTIARELGRFVREGQIYKGKKPVLWCARCRTALAEAETEYEEKESPSIYVKFPFVENVKEFFPNLKNKPLSLVIWTTTPWTLPANLAIALHPLHDYVIIPFGEEYLVVAKNLAGSFCKTMGIPEPEPVERFSGKILERKRCRHPFLERDSLIILSNHVTIDTGTGSVHTAPGHGEEDFVIGQEYHLPILTPVDACGKFTEECGIPEWVGLDVFEANQHVIQKLQEKGRLLKQEKIRHSYPHCWRCKNPLIFRATEQWFLSLKQNDLREKAVDAIRRTEWVPVWGRERILGMIQNRPDWCLSRQRSWGVPIIAFRCASCNHYLLDADLIEKIADRMEKEGSDIWFAETTEGLIGSSPTCPHCHGKKWEKEEDILDVWFDSGVSFAAVLEKNPSLQFPANLYLEGSDQHRGWFHSALLASIGTRKKAPYKTVLTHGFVVDGDGKKYSKSAGNYVPPEKFLKEYGAEILRLWVAAEDYRTDIRVSQEILLRLVDAYRKIRNTCRYLLGNLYDYRPDENTDAQLLEIDRWAVHQLQKLIQRVREGYDQFNFHTIFHELNRFCTVTLSSFYLDVLKDRLYASAPNDLSRRGAQKVLFEIASSLARLMAPILSFTGDEIWSFLPSYNGKPLSVHLTEMPKSDLQKTDEPLSSQWEKFLLIRDEIFKSLEKARNKKLIGSSLEARVILYAENEPKQVLAPFRNELPSLLLVSQVDWAKEPGENSEISTAFPTLWIEVQKASGKKCPRCWNYHAETGLSSKHPELCPRCVRVMETIG
ncbi:MAG: isoleucine--tRNA ligase [Deltaproteobacteria bacterium]|nr:isoleucine--tRNA ligase [Deltaproteobacteria bacterium]